MRSNFIRLAALVTCVAIVASCDSSSATGPHQVTTGGTSTGTTGGTTNNKNGRAPTVAIDSPATKSLVNVGDSILVTVRLHDDIGLKTASFVGVTQKGSVDLGTFSEARKYNQVTVPATGVFRTGLRDTTVRRYLQPISPTDTTVDSLIVRVIATDSLNLADTAQVRVDLVAGPKVNIVAPTNGDSIPGGVGLSVAARAQHPDGINRIDIRVRGETTWPTKLDTTITLTYTTAPRDITFSTVARIPADAPIRSKITITAVATDVNRAPGASSPVIAYVRSTAAAVPRVTQVVPGKSEYADSVKVSATGNGISIVGLIIRDSTGAVIQADTVKFPSPFNANVVAMVPLNLPPSLQGKKLGITAFAVDEQGRVGYAVTQTNQGSQSLLAAGLVDSTLVVYGRTYALPHQGVIGDVAVDAARGNVFLSNTAFNLLEVWQQQSATSKQFAPQSIAVGSLPWGLFISNNPDTLLVANSGGTNISRVFIGSTNASVLREDLANRILTRNTYIFEIKEARDASTGKIRLSYAGPISYSDRPQYISQSAGGRIFYSTRPTPTAPAGTIRWLDPSLPVPDPRQIWEYATVTQSTVIDYALFHVDSIRVGLAKADSPESDTLYVWDHPYGQASGVLQGSGTDPNTVFKSMCPNLITTSVGVSCPPKPGSNETDLETVSHLDLGTLALTDTTFAAASGNRNWIAFGEGHTSGAGRTIMVHDSDKSLAVPDIISPLVTISDLTDNASEKVFGLGIDKSGGTVVAHGAQSYFSAVFDPFHLRLQGKYDSADDGAGVAFHPLADGTLTPASSRLAFAASASGMIEIVDIAYYINRGKLPLKNPIYGPLRASLRMPGDPSNVVLKLYAVSAQGLIVIDLTAADIKPGP